MKKRLLNLKHLFSVPLFLMLIMAFGYTAKAQTLSLDQADLDYAPGETVYITGNGWQPGEEVFLQVFNETYPELNNTDHYAYWSVIVDSNGEFEASWPVTMDELNTSLILTADGQTSGFKYKVFFTDANDLTVSGKVQLANGTGVQGATVTGYTDAGLTTIDNSKGTGTTTSASDGTWSFTLAKNATRYIVVTPPLSFSPSSVNLGTNSGATSLIINNSEIQISSGTNGGTSAGNIFNLVVNNPVPTITSISPNNKCAGDAAFTVTVTGTNFINGSVIRFNGTDRTTTYVSSTQLTANITGTNITTAGNFPITVFNPTPGGGASSGVNFTVNNLPTVALITSGSTTTNVCVGSVVQLSNTTTGGVWGTTTPTLVSVSTTGLVSGILEGTANVTYTVTNESGCSTTRNKTVNVFAQPSAPTAVNYTGIYDGAAHTGSATVNTGEEVVWYANATGPETSIAPTGTSFGSYTAYAEARNTTTGCTSATRTLVTVNIIKASSSTVVTVADVTFDGNAHGASAAVTGVGGLSQTLTVTYAGVAPTVYGPSTTAPANAGTYNASASFAGDNNHNGSNDNKNFTIAPAAATITIAGGTWTYDADHHGASITTAKGVIGDGEDLSASVNLGDTFTDYPGGTAHWTFSNPNYVAQSGDVTITINKADLTVVNTNRSKVYGVTLTNVDYTGSITGIQAGDDITIARSSTGDAANATVVAPGPTYPIVGTLVDPNGRLANYNVTNPNGTLTVTKADLTVVNDSRSKVYGVTLTNTDYTGSISGIQAGDNITITRASTGDAANATVVAPGPTYPIVGTLIDPNGRLANYNVTNPNGVLTVTKANLVVVNTSRSKVYGEVLTNASYTGSITGIQAGDNITITRASTGDAAGATVVAPGPTYPIVGTLIDPNGRLANYNVTNPNGVLTVTTAATPLILTLSGYQVRYMDMLTYTAVIKPQYNVTPLTGTVTFTISGTTYTAPVVPIPGATDGSVQATVIQQLPASIMPGTYTVTAKFTSTNINYSDSNTDSKSLKVDPKSAEPYLATGFYTGDGFAWTTGPSSSTATVTLVAAIRDVNNPTGDVRGAKVSFFTYNGSSYSPISSAQNLPVGLIDPTDGSAGTASAIVQLNIGSNNSQSYQIAVQVTGGYTNDKSATLSQALVTVSKPVAGGYITGGSATMNTNSSGYIKGAAGLNTDFQFDIQYTKSGTNPKGKTNILVRSYYTKDGILDSKLHTYLITTNAIASLAVANPLATGTFTAKANLNEQVGDVMVAIEGGATFQMVAFQNACDQKIAITLYRKAGGVWFSSNWDAVSAKSILQPVASGSSVYVSGGGTCTGTSSNTLLVSSKNPSIETELVTFKATVSGAGTPSGTITFKDGSAVLATIPMVAGSASYSTSALTVGNHNISAVYSSDLFNKASQAVLTQTVSSMNKAAVINNTVTPIVTNEPMMKAYPNPFTDRLNIEFSSATDGMGKLEIFGVTGAKLATLYNGPVEAGVLNTFEYVPTMVSSQMVFYHLTIDGKTYVGKAVFQERR